MLPVATSPEFPAALKARRLGLGMSRAQLAIAIGIHPVMTRRYELEPGTREFTRPKRDTWVKLNRALGYEVGGGEAAKQEGKVSLQDISTEELVEELHRRNFAVTLSYRTADQANPQQHTLTPLPRTANEKTP